MKKGWLHVHVFFWDISTRLFSRFFFLAPRRLHTLVVTLETRLLCQSYKMPSEWFSLLQRLRFKQLLRRAEQLSFFCKKYDKQARRFALKLPAQHFSALPLLEREEFFRYNEQLERDLPNGRYYREHTSGSTSAPMYFYEDTATIPSRVARYRRQRYWIEGGQPSQLVRIMNRERLGFEGEGECITINEDCRDEELLATHERLIGKSKTSPIFLEAIASQLLRLAQLIHEHSLRTVPVTGLLTFGETLTSVEQKFIEDVFGAQIHHRYSLREFSTVAQECGQAPPNTFHIIAEYFYIEIVDESGCVLPPGEVGTIVITSFINRVMPFIRYNTRDRGRLLTTSCPCGGTLPLLEICGRTSAPVVFTNNTTSRSALTEVVAAQLCEKGSFQIVQRSSRRLDIRVQLFEQYQTKQQEKKLVQAVAELVGNEVDVCIVSTTAIPLSAGGKRVLFLDEVKGR